LKLKYLIIAFSIIIVFILSIIGLLSFVLLQSDTTGNLRYITFPLFIFMIFVLVSLVIFFLLNYRLLSLLDREDWPALSYYLEQKIYVKGRYNARKVQLLASSYMVISDYPSVIKLEGKAMLAKPSVVEKNVMIFGSARVLSGNYPASAAFFKSYLDKSKLKGNVMEWVRWFYGFSHLLGSSFRQAEPEFLSLALSSSDAIITALSAYFLETSLAKHSLKPDECMTIAANGKKRVLDALKNIETWEREVGKIENEIHVSIIRKYVEEAGKWLFADNIKLEESKIEESQTVVKPSVKQEDIDTETDTETL